jgi:hypothetical protein
MVESFEKRERNRRQKANRLEKEEQRRQRTAERHAAQRPSEIPKPVATVIAKDQPRS